MRRYARLRRLLPAALLLGGMSFLLFVPDYYDWSWPVVSTAAYAVTIAGILLGLRFANVRVVIALVIMALVEQALRWAPVAGASGRTVGIAVALLAPLNLAALAWTPDRGARRAQVRLWTPIIAVQVFGIAMLLQPHAAEAARALWRTFVDPVTVQWTVSGPLTVLVSLVAFGLVVARFALRPRATEAGLVGAVVATLLALNLGGEQLVATIYLTTGGLIMIVALIETSYAMAYGDELTGLPGRRALNELLGALGPRYAVAMIDIDHFKKFNDTYGHQAGDQLLRKVATMLGGVSGGGRSFRYGGEEFAVVFSGLSVEDVAPHLEALREAIASSSFTLRRSRRRRGQHHRGTGVGGRERLTVTVSIGVADDTGSGPAPADVVKAADEALYRAKHAGRNRLATAKETE